MNSSTAIQRHSSLRMADSQPHSSPQGIRKYVLVFTAEEKRRAQAAQWDRLRQAAASQQAEKNAVRIACMLAPVCKAKRGKYTDWLAEPEFFSIIKQEVRCVCELLLTLLV